ncbi:MAG: prepilin-type N-terminal cleavage/methylation domain-containing protein [Magnetococcales bacterium]|nr:prepilin-type N-terminal cleavage/methylation domain-containing protein [Magnetococcales bacterium]
MPSGRLSAAPSTETGFTLIELIMVVVMIGLMATSALSMVPQDVDRVSWARRLVGDLRLAQSYAMNRGVNYRLIRTSTSSYEIRDINGTPFPGSSVTLPEAIFSSFDIVFDRLGQPVNGAATITVTDRNAQISTVTLLATTGVVRGP